MTAKNPNMRRWGKSAGDGGSGQVEAAEGSKAVSKRVPRQAVIGSADPAHSGTEVETGEARSDGGYRAEAFGWTEGSIVRLLSTIDAVSSDAAESRSMLEMLTGGTGERVRVQTGDFHRWVESDRFRRRRWTAIAVAAAAPVALLLGILVEQQFQVIPLNDSTGGWRSHVWENYGRAIVDCVVEARRVDGEVNCTLVVRRP